MNKGNWERYGVPYFTDCIITYTSDVIFIGKDKAKLSLWSIKLEAMKEYAQMEVQLHPSLTSALDADQ
jgi:hypothetical protein